jgi:hypothetical protein
MTTDPLELLAASNPVRELPPVAPFESLACLRERPSAGRAKPARRMRRSVVRAAILVGVVAGGAALLFSDGSSGPGVNIAAAAFAATSAGNGVIEAEFLVRSGRPQEARAPLFRRREWLQAATGRRREQTLSGTGKIETETATGPGMFETWVAGPTATGTIVRSRIYTSGIESLKPDGLALYRQLYQDRGVSVVGRTVLDGQPAWKLESVVGWAIHRTGGPSIPIIGEVVLVDPHTYLPVVERQVNLTRAGHPTMIESRLTRYRRLSRTASSERLVLLSTVRPGAKIMTTGVTHPIPLDNKSYAQRPGHPEVLLQGSPTLAGP